MYPWFPDVELPDTVPVRIRFVRGEGWISRAICEVTWSRWSHVELVTDDGYLGAHNEGGVQVRDLDYAKVVDEMFGVAFVTKEQSERVLDYAMDQLGKPYDYTALAGIIFHRDWAAAKRWFCSELIAASFDYAGVPLLKRIPYERITPGMLAQSPELEFFRVSKLSE